MNATIVVIRSDADFERLLELLRRQQESPARVM